MRNFLLKSMVPTLLGTTLLLPPRAIAKDPAQFRGSSLQSFLDDLMRGQKGAAIITNPSTGEVLAVSNPRVAFEQVFPPGSTAKIVESAAALEEGAITPQDRILCQRVPELLGDGFHCTHPPSAEPFTISSALANSCNYFFVTLSLRLRSASLAHWYSLFGFGQPAKGLGRKGPTGLVRVGRDAREKARCALGEQTILVTPAQLLIAYSAVATGGEVFPLRRVGRGQSRAPARRLRLKQETREALVRGLEECVRSATGQAAAVQGIRIAGKTGTATALDGSKTTHAWFAGYAPAEAPKIALVVFLERGTGARDAAPLAGKIFRYYFQAKGAETNSLRGGAPRGQEFRVQLFSKARSGTSQRRTVTVGLENYVAGVLAGEAATMHAPAALQAMAVVARTWAVRWRGRHRSEGFDFCSLTHCQAFRLPSDEAPGALSEIAEAIQATRGEILKYNDRPIDPYFSANCGGVTEAAKEVWLDRAEPYLKSFSDPYCVAKGSFSWQRSLALEAVEQVLRQDLAVPLRAPLRGLSVEDRDSSGRARVLVARAGVSAQAGASARIDANQFRFAVNRRLGWNTLKSNLYQCEQRNGEVVFTGRGLGHGVGLCQAGAEQMGRLGTPYQAILATYFPGTILGQAARSESAVAASSEHFELVYPAAQQPLVNETLETLETLRRELGDRAKTLPAKVRVQAYESTEQFIRATGRPAWAAAASGAETIELQPLRTLKRKGILKETLEHELYHLALRPLRAAGVPSWYEEGMVEYLTGERVVAPRNASPAGNDWSKAFLSPRTEAEMRYAYAAALERVKRLAREQGHAALWRVLEHPTADDLSWLRGDK